MIIDASALVAIIRNEDGSDRLVEAVLRSSPIRLSSAGYLETAIVVDALRQPLLSRKLDDFIAEAEIVIEPFTEGQAKLAREAYRDFGKGSGHPAGLNFGDCITYALAKDKREPLLFKGDDFKVTDVESALSTN